MGFRVNPKTIPERFKVLALNSPEECRDLAFKMKGHGGMECERAEKEIRKRRIREKLTGGETIAFNFALGRVVETGLTRRVDSQHTCEVFLEMTPEEWAKVRFPLVAFWGEYDCDTTQDLSYLFEQFNAQWSVRDNKDIMGAHVNVHEDLRSAKVSVHIALPVAIGLVWYRNRIGGQKLAKEAKYEIPHQAETHDFFIRCNSFLHPRKTKEMLSPPVIAALHCTATDDASWAFWRNTASGKSADLDPSSAEFKLSEFLDMVWDEEKTEWPRNIARHFTSKKGFPNDLEVFATCLHAFRAWKTGRKVTDVFRPIKDKKPAEILVEFADVLGHRGEEDAA